MPVPDLSKLIKRMTGPNYQRDMEEKVASIRSVTGIVPDDFKYEAEWTCSNCKKPRLGFSSRPAFMCQRCDLIACLNCYRYDLKVCKKCVG